MLHDIVKELTAKKYEILGELELAKGAIMREMSNVDKCTLSKLRDIIAHYDRLERLVMDKMNAFDTKVSVFIKSAESTNKENNEAVITAKKEYENIVSTFDGFREEVRNLNREFDDYNKINSNAMGDLRGALNGLTDDYRELSGDLALLETDVAGATNKKILDATRFYVDGVNGSDNNNGSQAYPFKTLDKFFSVVNDSVNGCVDVRCWIVSPGVYKIGAGAECYHVFSHCTIHICGGRSDEDLIDGVILEFQTTERIKFYEAHTNLRNVTVKMPNTDLLDIDGGVFYFTKCTFDCPLKFEYAKGSVIECTFPHVICEHTAVTFEGATVTNPDPNRDAFEFVNSIVRFIGPFNYEGFPSGVESTAALFKGILTTMMIQFGVGAKTNNYQYGFEGYGTTIFATQARLDALKNNFTGGINTTAPCLFVTETTELKA